MIPCRYVPFDVYCHWHIVGATNATEFFQMFGGHIILATLGG